IIQGAARRGANGSARQADSGRRRSIHAPAEFISVGFDVYFTSPRRKYSGEIWATKNDRLLIRFHCPTESDYDEAYELHGVKASEITARNDAATATSAEDVWPPWAPPCIVEQWDEWLSSVL
ncbi:MAG: hypothetical protein ACREHD_23760, partial [Pirellulales bacterium]